MAGETVTDILEDDAFSSAFDSFLDEPKPEDKPVVEAKVDAPAEETPVVETPAVPEVLEAKPEPEAKPATAIEIAQAVASALKPVEVAKVEPVVAPDPEDPEVLAALADLEKNWPTQAIAVKALLKDAISATRKEMLAEFQKTLEPLQAQLAPVVASTVAAAQEQFDSEVKAAHPDAWDLLPKVEEWIKKQPAYLRPAYDAVLDGGNSAAVNDLLTRFKAELPPVVVPDPAVAAERAAKLRKMETPGTVRTSVTAEPDPQDFDSGWDAGVKKAVA